MLERFFQAFPPPPLPPLPAVLRRTTTEGRERTGETPRFLPQVYRSIPYFPPQYDGEIRALAETIRYQLLAKGYHPDLVEMGIEWGINTAWGTATHIFRFLPDDANLRINVAREVFKYYLNKVEEWVRSLSR